MMALSLPQEINALIQQLNAGQFAPVANRARQLAAQFPREFILHHLLALALDQSQQYPEAKLAYAQALKLQPSNVEL